MITIDVNHHVMSTHAWLYQQDSSIIFRAVSLLAFLSLAYGFWKSSSKSSLSLEPLNVSHWLPWLGHGIEFITDFEGMMSRIQARHGDQGIVNVQCAGRRIYLVNNRKLIGDVYRRHIDFVFDPFNVWTQKLCGATSRDIQIISQAQRGLPGSLHGNDERASNILQEMHDGLAAEFRGENLEEMTQIFMHHFQIALYKRIGPSSEYQIVDVVSFLKECWTTASATAVFGTNIFKIWPTINQDFWDFEGNITKFLAELPWPIFHHAHHIREQCLSRFVQWEREAIAHSTIQERETSGTKVVWDEHWGYKSMYNRNKICHRYGLSEHGRASFQLALLFGSNSNAIPTALWACLQCFLNPDLKKSIEEEVDLAPSNDIYPVPIPGLSTHPRSRSLFLECLRWSNTSAGLRVTAHDTRLGNYSLKSKTMIFMHTRALHRSPDLWDDPDAFQPTRFLRKEAKPASKSKATATPPPSDEPPSEAFLPLNRPSAQVHSKAQHVYDGGKTSADSYDPRLQFLRAFGGGPTLCPGRHFAANEILGGLSMVLSALDVKVHRDLLEKHGSPQPKNDKQGGLLPDRPLMCWVRWKGDRPE